MLERISISGAKEYSRTVQALIQAFWRILLLRDAPQSIPASAVLMWLALLLHYVVGFTHALFSIPFSLSLIYALVSTLTMVAVVHGLLLLFRKHARYQQTLSALAACEAMLGLLLLPVNIIYTQDASGEMQGLLAIISLLAIGWNVALAAHIFRHALSVSKGLGFFYSVAYLILAITLGDMIVGSAAGVTR
jgi:hypothetical protein